MNRPTSGACPKRPSLLVAHCDPRYAVRTCRTFRNLGWDVYTAQSVTEVNRLSRKLVPDAVVLAETLWDESGWLTCDKLRRQQPDLRVFLVGANPTRRSRQLARFVGAAGLLDEREDPAEQIEEVLGCSQV